MSDYNQGEWKKQGAVQREALERPDTTRVQSLENGLSVLQQSLVTLDKRMDKWLGGLEAKTEGLIAKMATHENVVATLRRIADDHETLLERTAHQGQQNKLMCEGLAADVVGLNAVVNSVESDMLQKYTYLENWCVNLKQEIVALQQDRFPITVGEFAQDIAALREVTSAHREQLHRLKVLEEDNVLNGWQDQAARLRKHRDGHAEQLRILGAQLQELTKRVNEPQRTMIVSIGGGGAGQRAPDRPLTPPGPVPGNWPFSHSTMTDGDGRPLSAAALQSSGNPYRNIEEEPVHDIGWAMVQLRMHKTVRRKVWHPDVTWRYDGPLSIRQIRNVEGGLQPTVPEFDSYVLEATDWEVVSD